MIRGEIGEMSCLAEVCTLLVLFLVEILLKTYRLCGDLRAFRFLALDHFRFTYNVTDHSNSVRIPSASQFVPYWAA